MILTDAGFKTALDGKVVGSAYLHTHPHTYTLSLFLEGGSTIYKE